MYRFKTSNKQKYIYYYLVLQDLKLNLQDKGIDLKQVINRNILGVNFVLFYFTPGFIHNKQTILFNWTSVRINISCWKIGYFRRGTSGTYVRVFCSIISRNYVGKERSMFLIRTISVRIRYQHHIIIFFTNGVIKAPCI